MALIQLPCGQWVIEGDSCLTPKAQAQDDIVIEREIRDLPAVRGLGKGSVAVDVGAFIGDTALIFLEQGCEVWAFEPYPDAFECLRRNCPAAHCLNVCVGDGRPAIADGTTLSKNGNLGMRTLSAGGAPSLRIDDLRLPRVDFIKIDVEGFEPAVLDGAERTIRQFKMPMYVEVLDEGLAHHGFGRADIFDRLKRLHYEWTIVGDERSNWFNLVCYPA